MVCVAGILRERMLFNMSEAEWDPVIETHLKGTFTVFRAVAPIFREQKSGTMLAFTSGAFAASVAQANYAAAKGGIVSLVRSAAAGMNKYGVTANCIAPVARSRMSGQVPFGLEMGEPEDVAPMVAFLCSDHARQVTGQIYTVNGGRVAVWNQPAEVRDMRKDGRWTVAELAARFDEVGQEPMPILAALAEREAAAKAARSRTSSACTTGLRLGAWKGEPSITLVAGERDATFLPGCGMLCASLRHRGDEYVAWPRTLAAVPSTASMTAVPFVHPWGNRLERREYRVGRRRVDLRGLDLPTDHNGLPMHGNLRGARVRRRARRGRARAARASSARLDYGARPDLLRAFPFPHVVTIDARLDEHGLRLTTEIEPTGRSRGAGLVLLASVRAGTRRTPPRLGAALAAMRPCARRQNA